MGEDWLDILETTVQGKPLVVFQLEEEDWWNLRHSRRGVNDFTIVRSHEAVRKVKTPTACLLFGTYARETEARFGLVASRGRVSTLDTRISVKAAQHIHPSSKSDLLQLVREQPYARNLQNRLASNGSVTVLSSKLSAHLVKKLAEIETNRSPMRTATASLSSPTHFHTMAAVQKDALQTALHAFGLSAAAQAVSRQLTGRRETALEEVSLVEDNVIAYDARFVPDYDLVGGDVTGYAVFERGLEKLEVYTANRLPLEHVFGVDLIYLNVTRQSIVMLQYKMLERDGRQEGGKDWIYRPDTQLDSEIGRMRQFSIQHAPGRSEYRLNPQVFHLKFVKRGGALKDAAIITPLDHFERLRTDPDCRGPRGGVRISFNGLAGRYLRQTAFLDLLRSGYIGAHAKTTAYLKELVEVVARGRGNKAIVAAIQSQRDDAETDLEEFDPMEDLD